MQYTVRGDGAIFRIYEPFCVASKSCGISVFSWNGQLRIDHLVSGRLAPADNVGDDQDRGGIFLVDSCDHGRSFDCLTTTNSYRCIYVVYGLTETGSADPDKHSLQGKHRLAGQKFSVDQD